jgi:hypothetical protein
LFSFDRAGCFLFAFAYFLQPLHFDHFWFFGVGGWFELEISILFGLFAFFELGLTVCGVLNFDVAFCLKLGWIAFGLVSVFHIVVVGNVSGRTLADGWGLVLSLLESRVLI